MAFNAAAAAAAAVVIIVVVIVVILLVVVVVVIVVVLVVVVVVVLVVVVVVVVEVVVVVVVVGTVKENSNLIHKICLLPQLQFHTPQSHIFNFRHTQCNEQLKHFHPSLPQFRTWSNYEALLN